MTATSMGPPTGEAGQPRDACIDQGPVGRANRFWEKEQTKADVEVFILDQVFAKLPTPPFTAEEKKAVAGNVYAQVWQQAISGELAKAA
jgi:hypothetical protein